MDLWNYKSPRGAGLQKALDYLMPYADPTNQRQWPYTQITPSSTNGLTRLLCQAIIHYPKSSQYYLHVYQSLKDSKYISANIENLLYGCISR